MKCVFHPLVVPCFHGYYRVDLPTIEVCFVRVLYKSNTNMACVEIVEYRISYGIAVRFDIQHLYKSELKDMFERRVQDGSVVKVVFSWCFTVAWGLGCGEILVHDLVLAHEIIQTGLSLSEVM